MLNFGKDFPVFITTPNYQGVYLRAQMELGGLLGHFWTLNQVKFRLVTFLGMFGKFEILPKQKNFFFATFFTLAETILKILRIKSPSWPKKKVTSFALSEFLKRQTMTWWPPITARGTVALSNTFLLWLLPFIFFAVGMFLVVLHNKKSKQV